MELVISIMSHDYSYDGADGVHPEELLQDNHLPTARLSKKANGGGTLLDWGVYCIQVDILDIIATIDFRFISSIISILFPPVLSWQCISSGKKNQRKWSRQVLARLKMVTYDWDNFHY